VQRIIMTVEPALTEVGATNHRWRSTPAARRAGDQPASRVRLAKLISLSRPAVAAAVEASAMLYPIPGGTFTSPAGPRLGQSSLTVRA